MKSFWNKYKHFIITVLGLMLLTTLAMNANAQVGSVKTEKYQADFEKKQQKKQRLFKKKNLKKKNNLGNEKFLE